MEFKLPTRIKILDLYYDFKTDDFADSDAFADISYREQRIRINKNILTKILGKGVITGHLLHEVMHGIIEYIKHDYNTEEFITPLAKHITAFMVDNTELVEEMIKEIKAVKEETK